MNKLGNLFFCIFFLKSTLFAQTVIIDPAGAGSFTLGNTFESNGWMVANFDNANGWAMGPFSNVPKTAFASANWNGTNPVPGVIKTGKVSVFHFYRDITLPADEPVIQLNFKLNMPFGALFVGLSSTDYQPGIGDFNVPANYGRTLRQYSYSSGWYNYNLFIPSSYAGTTIRLIFTGYYGANATPPDQATGPAVYGISLISRKATLFQSVAGQYDWDNPDAWLPEGVPSELDNVTISQGSSISGYGGATNNLIIFGNLSAIIRIVNGDLTVKPTGSFGYMNGPVNISGNLTIEEGGRVILPSASLSFTRSADLPPMQQVFRFHSPQQFFQGEISELYLNNPAGMQIKAASGRLVVGSRISMVSGTLVNDDDALELNHQNFGSYTLISFNGTGTWTKPAYRAPGSRIGLNFNGILGTPDTPYVLGSRGEWTPDDELLEFQINSYYTHVKSMEDIKVAVASGSRFRLLSTLQLAPGKTLIFTEENFIGGTPSGFPGPATFNIFNNAHVSGGAGVAYRLNGFNMSRVWPVGLDGKQFVVGLYGINATNALVRVSAFRSEEGQAGAGLSAVNPLYRYKVEVLDGTLEKVDSVNFGYSTTLGGFINGDQNNRRVAASDTLNGTYNEIGGPSGGFGAVSSFWPEWNFGWVRSKIGNYNKTSYYALGLSEGKFAVMWRNNPGGSLLWDDPANWTGNAVPTLADPVIIHAPGTTITVSDNSACKQLTITNGTNLVVPPGVRFKVGG